MHDQFSNVPRSRVDLRDLPMFAPDASLWLRVQSAQMARTRARWRRNAGLGVAVAASVCAAVLLMPHTPPQAPLEQAIVADQRESRALEGEWLRITDAKPPTRPVTRLRAIDARLQAAYDRRASAAELGPLWQQRNRALRELIARTADGSGTGASRITRI